MAEWPTLGRTQLNPANLGVYKPVKISLTFDIIISSCLYIITRPKTFTLSPVRGIHLTDI